MIFFDFICPYDNPRFVVCYWYSYYFELYHTHNYCCYLNFFKNKYTLLTLIFIYLFAPYWASCGGGEIIKHDRAMLLYISNLPLLFPTHPKGGARPTQALGKFRCAPMSLALCRRACSWQEQERFLQDYLPRSSFCTRKLTYFNLATKFSLRISV